MASLIYRTAQKRKNGKQKPSSLKETVRTIAYEGSPVERNETLGEGDL